MTCPLCKKPTDPTYSPFCSRRCADVDLGRWLTESYAIPVDDNDEDAGPKDQSGTDWPER